MRAVEPEWLEVTRTRIDLLQRHRTSGPLRVLHLSDLHAHHTWVRLPLIAEAVSLGLAEKPDVICLTGDFITSHYENFSAYAEVLRPLARAAPTFACLGNHDGGGWARDSSRGYASTTAVRGLLEAAGVQLLHNTTLEIAVRGHRVQLSGVGDLWADQCRPPLAFAAAPPREDALRLLLNHNPDAKVMAANFDWDVMLSGHTHGGQIGFAPLARRVAPVADKRYIAGLYRWENRHLFITRGVGNLHGARLFCRPEVSMLEIA